MTPFDLEKAKAGEPVVTEDGRKARYLGTINSEFPYVFAVDCPLNGVEIVVSYSADGVAGSNLRRLDLFMAPKTKKMTVNIYQTSDGKYYSLLDGEDQVVKLMSGAASRYMGSSEIEVEV